MKIIVSYKKVYGKDLFYPVSEDAIFLTKFSGRPTLSKNQLKLLSDRGYEVSLKQDTVDLVKFLKSKKKFNSL